jgi:decaprenylphospho-beta-D-erythro-pentofuranosid-2-ulose 2-reductase
MTELNILVFGATSAIAEEITKKFAINDNANLFLVGRNKEKLNAIADDMQVLGAKSVKKYYIDLGLLNEHYNLIEKIFMDAKQRIDHIIIAHGSLTNEDLASKNIKYALEELNLNLTSFISLSLLIANKLEIQSHGSLTLISSVAGDRGRQKVCVYSCAKSGITTLGQALAQRLIKFKINVLTVKPGLIDTPMISNYKNSPLIYPASKAGLDIYKAIKSKKKIIYTPWFWRYIMFIIRLLPQNIFLKTKF